MKNTIYLVVEELPNGYKSAVTEYIDYETSYTVFYHEDSAKRVSDEFSADNPQNKYYVKEVEL